MSIIMELVELMILSSMNFRKNLTKLTKNQLQQGVESSIFAKIKTVLKLALIVAQEIRLTFLPSKLFCRTVNLVIPPESLWIRFLPNPTHQSPSSQSQVASQT